MHILINKNYLTYNKYKIRCTIGKRGIGNKKKEGDLITPKGNIHNDPIITFRGLPIYETDEFIYSLEEEIEKTTKTFNIGNKSQRHNLIDALKIAARRFTKEKTGKRPFTNINLVDI